MMIKIKIKDGNSPFTKNDGVAISILVFSGIISILLFLFSAIQSLDRIEKKLDTISDKQLYSIEKLFNIQGQEIK